MGANFNGASDYLNDTTNFLDMNAAYTMMGWFRYPSSPTGAPNVIFAITNTAGTSYDLLRHDNNVLGSIVDGTAADGSTLSANTWYHVALVRSSTSDLKVYLDGNATADSTNSTSVAARGSANQESVGGILATYDLNGDLFGVKEWDTNLTTTEIQQEMYAIRAIKRTNLFRETPIFAGSANRLLDYSGNGYDWTANGTITDVGNPPISWGSQVIYNPYEPAPAAGGRIMSSLAGYGGLAGHGGLAGIGGGLAG